MQINWEGIWESVKAHKHLFLTLIGLVLLTFAVIFTIDRCEKWQTNKAITKQKQDIVNKIEEIKSINSNIEVLKQDKAAKAAEVNAAVQQLHNDVFGLEEAKKESNQALANFEKALNTNTAVDVTAKDLEDKLKELEAHQ